jgi:hypothetical protein
MKLRVRIAHIIGQFTRRVKRTFDEVGFIWQSVDYQQTDYAWWDAFRHGLKKGYEFASIVAISLLETIANHVMGKGVSAILAPVQDKRMTNKIEYTNDTLSQWMRANQKDFKQLYVDYLALGDQYVVVNPDASLTFISPNLVEQLFEDELQPGKVTGYRITVSGEKSTVITTYTDTERIIKVKKSGQEEFTTFTKKVLIGQNPVVPFHYNKGRNEVSGRPFYQSLLNLFSELNDLIIKGVQGGKVAGNPVPVFENLHDPDETLRLNATEEEETYFNKDGDEEERVTIKWDGSSVILLGEGGRFKFASPNVGFSKDINDLIQLLLTLVKSKGHTPDHVWGGADKTTQAGAEAETPSWVMFLEGMRDEFNGVATDDNLNIKATSGFYLLLDTWLKTKALSDPKIFVGPTILIYPDLTEFDRKLKFEIVKWAHSRTLLTNLTTLTQLKLVENPRDELEAAQLERPEPLPEFDDDGDPLADDTTPDNRTQPGAKAPRMPATGGGGKVK